MTARDDILQLIATLPDVPTYADAFDLLRPLYNREVAPIIAQYGNPPRPHGHWRRDITGPAESEEQKFVKTDKPELLQLMQLLPADATAPETVDEAMYKLVLSYCIDKADQQIAEGKGFPYEEVGQRMAQRRRQGRMTELPQEEGQ